MRLVKVWDSIVVDFTYIHTQRNADGHISSNMSIVDHFCASPNIIDCIDQAGVLHSADTAEDHSPIYLKLSIDVGVSVQNEEVSFIERPAWKKASDKNIKDYRNILSDKFINLSPHEDILLCRDVHCCDPNHLIKITEFTTDVLEAVVDSVKDSIPVTKPPSSKSNQDKCLPGWNERVKPFKKEADFWFSLWISSGKPQNTELHWAMRNSRNQYHYAIRRVKKQMNSIKNNKFLDACMNGGVDLFKEIKKHRGNTGDLPKTVDDISGDKPISNHFKSIYSDLFNSVPSNIELQELLRDINGSMDENDLGTVDLVDASLINEAINRLKLGKSDSNHDFGSDAFIHASDILSFNLSFLFKTFLIHGFTPIFLLVCSLVPIIKDKLGDASSSDNYRAIAISSLLLKIFDWIILILHGDKLSTSDFQFGF